MTGIDAFVDYYNHKRPHRGIGRNIPAQRWAATPPAINLGVALPGPALATTVTVASNGIVRLGGTGARAWIGSPWAGHTATVHYDDNHAAVFIDHQLVRVLTLTTGTSYYPKPRP